MPSGTDLGKTQAVEVLEGSLAQMLELWLERCFPPGSLPRLPQASDPSSKLLGVKLDPPHIHSFIFPGSVLMNISLVSSPGIHCRVKKSCKVRPMALGLPFSPS